MEKFEYKIITVSLSHLEKEKHQQELMNKLNTMGSEGWEMVSAEGINESTIIGRVSDTTKMMLFFKRKVQ